VLARGFYDGDALGVAPLLLNKLLVHGELEGRIFEVEAYMGEDDPGSHAYRGQTPRTATMFGPGGHLYVYFTYGMHHCANVVCGRAGTATAVLLRALEPVAGIEEMWGRRPRASRVRDLCSGPGKLCQALGLDRTFDGADVVTGDRDVCVVDDGTAPPRRPRVSTRIGLRAGAGDDFPWRFCVPGSEFLSRRS
jgi:DNA-3-methyladenine glycosylase